MENASDILLTDRQREVLKILRADPWPTPSLMEIADIVGVHHVTIWRDINELVEMGIMQKADGARSFRITPGVDVGG